MISRADTGSANVNPESLQSLCNFSKPDPKLRGFSERLRSFAESNGRAGASIARSGSRSCSSAAQRATVHLLTGLDGERVHNGFTKNRIREMSNT